ncbi:MAG: hypothetical protein GY911_09730 [Actinomycetales bacterium]|nr:hypothetical protein [Actinomycetales bacterium]
MSRMLGEPTASFQRLDASSMNDLCRTLLAAAALACSSAIVSAETITVCADGCDYTSINAAIGAANEGDVIQLAAETYFEGEQIDTLGKAITLRGVLNRAGEPASVLDGAGTHRVLICQGDETVSTVFENLLIQSGEVSSYGGGMYNDSSSPKLTNCAFTGNSAYYRGGGMYNDNGSSPTLTNCAFTSNSANAPALSGLGGGLCNAFGSSPVLVNCAFGGNSATQGGGMFNDRSNPTLVGCTFTGNSASDNGGGMRNASGSPTLTNCAFTKNSSDFGGGMLNLSSSPILVGCSFTGNSAELTGGGMYNQEASSPTLTACAFTCNAAGWVGGMYNNIGSSPTLADCTFTGNAAVEDGGGIYNNNGSSSTLTACTLCENVPDQIDGSWTDAGDNCVATSCDDCDLPSDACPTDLDRNGITDGGDLGAFFVHWGECQVEDCPADFNDDEVVDGIDLGILFSAWGPCQ